MLHVGATTKSSRISQIWATGAKRMLAGGVGPLASLPVLFLLPLLGALLLESSEFAIWAILNSVASIAVALDFGGATYAATVSRSTNRIGYVVWKGGGVSAIGAVVITLVSVGIWIPYSQTEAASAWTLMSGAAALVVIGLAAVLRGFVAVAANAALAVGDYRSRNFLLLGQSAAMVLIAVAVMLIWDSAWALPVAMLASCALVLAIGIPVLLSSFARYRESVYLDARSVTADTSIRTFATQRTVATMFSSALLQGDRWVVGAVGGAEFLAVYELVARMSSAPRVVAQSVTASLFSDAGPAFTRGSLPQLRSTAARLVMLVIGATVLATVVFLIGLVLLNQLRWSDLLLAVPLLIGFVATARSAVTSSIGIGLGRPGIDIPVLSVMLGLVLIAWAAALLLQDVWVAVWGAAVVSTIATVVYVAIAERPFRKGMRI